MRTYYTVMWGPLVIQTDLWLDDTPIFFDMRKVWYSYIVLPQKDAAGQES